LRLKAILLCVVALAIVVVYFWRANQLSRVNDVTALDTKALLRNYASGNLSSTAATIQALATTDTDLLILAASCYRRLGMRNEFQSVINEAKENGIDSDELKRATDLFNVEIGMFDESAEQTLLEFEQRGIAKDDARRAVIMGSLMHSDLAGASGLIDQWYLQEPESGELRYLRAMLATSRSRWNEAETLLLDSIADNEQHELSYLALADMYSEPPNISPEKCRLVYEQCLLRFPENEGIAVRLARVNRELGNNAAASEILETQEPSQVVLFEKAEIALDTGLYAESTELMSKGGLSGTARFVSLIDVAFRTNLGATTTSVDKLSQQAKTGAIALALGGRNKEAAVALDFVFDRTARLSRFHDLQLKIQLSPNDPLIAAEIEAVVAPAINPGCPTLTGTTQDDEEDVLSPGDRLYMDHCAACHGRTGEGLGISARHLFPAPRSFRDEPIRIVSTFNRVASDQDLAKSIREGLGGVSMPAFPQLSVEQIEQLVAVVRRLQVDGLRNQYERIMLESGFESDGLDESREDESAINRWVEQRSTPGEPLKIPKFDDLSGYTTASGKAAFDRAGCKQCHAASSQDGNTLPMFFDTLGRPVAIRDLVADRFRGGNAREEIYKRIVLGMPGTSHPAISGLSEREIVDIVQYVHELSKKSHEDEQPRIPATTNYERRLQAALNHAGN
jgi:mono/diheme cytochrome c family protein